MSPTRQLRPRPVRLAGSRRIAVSGPAAGQQIGGHLLGVPLEDPCPGKVVVGEHRQGGVDLHGGHLEAQIQAGPGIGPAGAAQIDHPADPGVGQLPGPPPGDRSTGGLLQPVASPQHRVGVLADLGQCGGPQRCLVQGCGRQLGRHP